MSGRDEAPTADKGGVETALPPLITRPLTAAAPGHAPLPLLEGRLTGERGAPSIGVIMLLDTGADGIYVRPGLAPALGLAKLESPWTVKTPAALQTAAVYSGAIEFDTDLGSVEHLPCFVVELPGYSAAGDLLFGMGQLRHFEFVLDGPNNQFTLRRPR